MSIDSSIDSQNGSTNFVFVHTSSYKEVQMKFFEAVESQNSENIIVSVSIEHHNAKRFLATQSEFLPEYNEHTPVPRRYASSAVGPV